MEKKTVMKHVIIGASVIAVTTLSMPISAITVFIDSNSDGAHDPLIEMSVGETFSVDVWGQLDATEDAKGGLISFGTEVTLNPDSVAKIVAATFAPTWNIPGVGEPDFTDNSAHAFAGTSSAKTGSFKLFSFDLQALTIGDTLLSLADYPDSPPTFDSYVLADGTVLDNNVNYLGSKSTVQAAPEPATLAIMTLGLAGIGYSRQRSKSAA